MRIIKTSMRVLALDQRYLDAVPTPDISQVPFDDIFEGKWRFAIPIQNDKIQKIIEMLENGETNSGNSYQVDLENQIAYRTVETKRGGEKKMQSRLGKTIRRELDQKWADEFSRQMGSDNKGGSGSEYTIIISRHPMDIVRMSDHREWSSCHAPPGWNDTGVDKFHCAFEEATDGGPIAYIVRTDDFELVEDELQREEIFKDMDREVAGLTPLSRLRINRYQSQADDSEIAIPVESIYGVRVAGFYDTVKKYFYNQQREVIDNYLESGLLDLDHFGRYGGSYWDYNDDTIFEKFFDVEVSGTQADYIGEGDVDLAELWAEELAILQARADKLKYTGLWSEPSDDGNFLSVTHTIYFTFPNIIEESIPIGSWGGVETNTYSADSQVENLKRYIEHINKREEQGTFTQEDIKNKKEYTATLEITEKKGKQIGNFSRIDEEAQEIIRLKSNFNCEETEWEIQEDKIMLKAQMSVDDIESPDHYGERIQEAESFEEDEYSVIYYMIYTELAQGGIIEPYPTEDVLDNEEFKNLDIDFDNDDGTYTIKSEIGIITVPEIYKQKIAQELYDTLFGYIMEIYNDNRQGLLFETGVEKTVIDRQKLPQPELRINETYDYKTVPDPYYADASEPWRYTKRQTTPTGLAGLNITFYIPFMDFEKYDNNVLNTYLRQLDKNIENLSLRIYREAQIILERYQQEAESARIEEQRAQDISQDWSLGGSKHWYRKRGNISLINWYKTIKAMPLAPITNEYPYDDYGAIIDQDDRLLQETIDKHLQDERAYLGHGAWGVVYDTPKAGIVEKISRSDSDYNNALEVMKKQKENGGPLSYCVEVYDTQKIQEDPTIYRIFLEKVKNLDESTELIFDKYYRRMKGAYSNMLNLEGMRLMQEEYEIPDEHFPLIEQIRQFMLKMRRDNIDPWDVYGHNVGFRGEDIVILDIGAFNFLSGIAT